MADQSAVHTGENSPEEVAFKLLQLIASVEQRESSGHGKNPMSREYIIRTYCQCLRAVHAPHTVDDIVAKYPG
ncbi:hypothetical protein A6F68_01217 [Tsuneonella dongtanensis]|uniref:Uncharacterized protein n=1 Tax=Tsuneonella dongtanensis TaxID=692370 RepID=A0A1B2ACA5_9SPHN|nr:hypothetical protein [Tsuneonella dongtanensis]ANY19734.1 hypothetical protein A6F68_01217 [Tsuneonella dongtanensis]